jgi:hypothetical protein
VSEDTIDLVEDLIICILNYGQFQLFQQSKILWREDLFLKSSAADGTTQFMTKLCPGLIPVVVGRCHNGGLQISVHTTSRLATLFKDQHGQRSLDGKELMPAIAVTACGDSKMLPPSPAGQCHPVLPTRRKKKAAHVLGCC